LVREYAQSRFPVLTNLRLDPFERTVLAVNVQGGSTNNYNWFVYEFWRFVHMQQQVAKIAETTIEFPPMQRGASFNLDAVKAQVGAVMKAHSGQ
jgi:arylsulfatase